MLKCLQELNIKMRAIQGVCCNHINVAQIAHNYRAHGSHVSLILIFHKLKRLFTVATAVELSSRTIHSRSGRHKGCDEIVHPSIQHACTVQTFDISMTGYNLTIQPVGLSYLWVCVLHPSISHVWCLAVSSDNVKEVSTAHGQSS